MLANCARCFRVHNKRFSPDLCEACHGQKLSASLRRQEQGVGDLYQAAKPAVREGAAVSRPRDRFDRPWRQAR